MEHQYIYIWPSVLAYVLGCIVFLSFAIGYVCGVHGFKRHLLNKLESRHSLSDIVHKLKLKKHKKK